MFPAYFRIRRHVMSCNPSQKVAVLLAGLVIALGLGGCDATGGSPSEPQPESRAATTESDTIDYQYQGYQATIPADPQRVVVLDSRLALELAILADYPIIATAYDEDSHLASRIGDDVAHLKSSAFEINQEEVASFDPDLIVVSAGWWNVYVEKGLQLEEIAPVLVVYDPSSILGSGDAGNVGSAFDAMSDQLTLLGRGDKVESALADYEKAVEEAKKQLGDLPGRTTVSVVFLDKSNFQVITDDVIFQDVIPALGFQILDNETISSAPPNQGGIYHALSYEYAFEALGDVDLLMVQGVDAQGGGNETWNQVPAIEQGHWSELDYANRAGFALTHIDFVNDLVGAAQKLER